MLDPFDHPVKAGDRRHVVIGAVELVDGALKVQVVGEQPAGGREVLRPQGHVVAVDDVLRACMCHGCELTCDSLAATGPRRRKT